MKTQRVHTIAIAQLLAAAVAVAQTPPEPARPAPAEAKLHSLQLLLTETIFARQPLAAPAPDAQPKPGAPAGGSSGDRPFAIVRDATFEADGRLMSLVVEAPSTDGGRGAAPRVLPASSVQWDEATKRWLMSEVSLQWAELAEFKHPSAEAPTKEPVSTASQHPVLASELLNATVAGFAPSASGASEAIQTKGNTKVRTVWWLSPVNKQLSFAVVSHGDKFLAVPWALMRANGRGETTEIRIQAAPTAADGAPTVASAMEQPSAAVRQSAYRHYGVEVPKWDQAMAPPAKGTEKGGQPPRQNER